MGGPKSGHSSIQRSESIESEARVQMEFQKAQNDRRDWLVEILAANSSGFAAVVVSGFSEITEPDHTVANPLAYSKGRSDVPDAPPGFP